MKTPQKPDNDETYIARADQRTAGKMGAEQRPDRQPLLRHQLPQRAALPRSRPTSHADKIFAYRDRCLALLRPIMDPDVMLRFDERSQQALFSMPENSEIARYSDLAAFARFCADHAFTPFPANETTAERYLDHLVSLRRKRATIDRHMASLIYWHRLLDLDDPTAAFAVNARRNRAKRELTRPAAQAEGLRFVHLQRALGIFQPDILRDCADMALLFVAFDTLCRRSELVRFDWTDLAPDPIDASGLLRLSHSKTDQDGEGQWLYLSATTMRVLGHWQRTARLTSGALFRGIDSGNRLNERLSDKGVERAFKRIAVRLGFSPHLFSGHSTRVGAAQEMVEANIDTAGILLAGRWSDTRMVTRYAKKLNAKRSGSAALSEQLGTNRPDSVGADGTDSSSATIGFLDESGPF
ncbi:MAG: integrase [Porticoccaceae bacterium]|jgi:integrase